MADIGTATIRVVADSSPFERGLANLARGADRAGTRLGESLGRATGRALKVGLVAAAGGAAAAVGVTLAKGFRRFTTIEDATASLTLQLGDAAKAADLLGQVLKVVEGTPFALDQFVDAARNLVAAGIELEKVPGILTAVGDAAAAAGGSAEDVDNVVNAIGRLATGAELTLGPIRDLEELGVPALRILANQAGKSTQDMAKDISAGTVDSKKAIDDLVQGLIEGTDGINGATVAFGGSAKNVGNTVSGAFANMRIAVDRAGAKIIAVFAKSGSKGNALVRILNGIRETIDVLGTAAEKSAQRIVGKDGFENVLVFFDELPDRVERATRHLGQDGGFARAILALFEVRDFEELTRKFLDGFRRAFERIPRDELSAIMSTVIVRGIESLAATIPVIIAAFIRVGPSIIKGIGEGLLKAAKENPLNMALFLSALGIPGVGTALAGFFGALPFGFITKPLINGLTTAMRAGFAASVPAEVVPAVQGPLVAGMGTVGQVAGGVLAAAIVGALIGIEIQKRFIEPVLEEIDAASDHVEDMTARMKDRFIAQLAEMGVKGPEKLAPITQALNEMQREGDLTNEGMLAIFENLELIGEAAKNGIDVAEAMEDIALGGDIAEDAIQRLQDKIAEVDRAKANPEVRVDAGDSESTLDRILGKLGDLVGRAWRAVVGVDESGGASGSFHRGGLVMHKGGVVPKLHAGTMNRAVAGLGARLRSDERLAVLQVGELVLSRDQVAQARAGAGAVTQNITLNSVGDLDADVERVLNRLAAV